MTLATTLLAAALVVPSMPPPEIWYTIARVFAEGQSMAAVFPRAKSYDRSR